MKKNYIYSLLLISFALVNYVYSAENLVQQLNKKHQSFFNEGNVVFTTDPKYFQGWDSAVRWSKGIIEANSKNMIGVKDSVIMKYLKRIIAGHEALMEIINDSRSIARSKEVVEYGETLAAWTDELANLVQEMRNPQGTLQKLLKQQKKDSKKIVAIKLLQELGWKVLQVALKVQNDFNKKMSVGYARLP